MQREQWKGGLRKRSFAMGFAKLGAIKRALQRGYWKRYAGVIALQRECLQWGLHKESLQGWLCLRVCKAGCCKGGFARGHAVRGGCKKNIVKGDSEKGA